MAAGDYRIGLNGVFLYGTAGSTAATTALNITDVTLETSAIEADAKSRASTTWVPTKVAMLQATLTFTMLDEEGDAAIAAVKAAYFAKGKIAFYPTDVAGGDGLDADYNITGLSRNESLTEIISYSVTAKPNNEQREPSWH